MKIDVVYLWVDGNDKKWQKEKNKWLKRYHIVSNDSTHKARWRNNDELKYSLRSIAKNIPWANHIYIITGFNQVPKWLNTKNPRITIVSHSEIMPENTIPTFNSNAIAMCIGNIEQLNEHFLLFNDDIFINRPVSQNFFFTKNGRPIYRYKKRKNIQNIGKMMENKSEYELRLLNTQKLIYDLYNRNVYKYLPAHGVESHKKSTWIQCLKHPLLNKHIINQIYSKFRTNNGVQPQIFSLINIIYKHCKTLRVRDYKHTHNKLWNFIYNNILHKKSVHLCPFYCSDATKISELTYKPYDICVNDEPTNTDTVCKNNKRILEQMFPNKCEFEK